jgi:hypothetical protein
VIANRAESPPRWDDAALQRQAQKALEDFVQRRLAEPSSLYAKHLRERRRSRQSLFRELAAFDRLHPDIAIARKILSDPELESALRYVAGPPVSKDDLGVLVTRSPQRIGAAAIRTNPTLANGILALICQLADDGRFPWLSRNRKPKPYEL